MASAAVLEATTFAPIVAEGNGESVEITIGQCEELLPMSFFTSYVATTITTYLGPFSRQQESGRVIAESLFDLGPAFPRRRRPDVAFVSYQRWAKDRPLPEVGNVWYIVPNLAIEVVSPTDEAEELLEKVEEYFQAGVELVWVIYPRLRRVHIFESPRVIRVLGREDELDGGAVLPGFRLPLANVFEEHSPR